MTRTHNAPAPSREAPPLYALRRQYRRGHSCDVGDAALKSLRSLCQFARYHDMYVERTSYGVELVARADLDGFVDLYEVWDCVS